MNVLQKIKQLSAEQGEAVVGLGSSCLSLFAFVVIWGLADVPQVYLNPYLALIVCGAPACAGALVSLWALVLRPGWIPLLGVLVGIVGILAGLWLTFLLGFAQLA